ncbi:MAG: arylsulfatase [Planctomycetota bacterium]
MMLRLLDRSMFAVFTSPSAGCVIAAMAMMALGVPSPDTMAQRPNVVIIMSDDQGVGDYGFMGNPVIQTPNLDHMQEQGGLLTQFYVSPVCAPTRASLMTGRYNYRTRCIDTYVGRAMMDPAEVTMAELLSDAGYRTGIYGKWHLGDNYPMRPMDQGFQESLIHRGGGIGQPSDPIGAEGQYTDPTLFRTGEAVAMTGYCTDLYFDAAMEFIGDSVRAGEPFLTYIATNAPHGPFHDVPEELYQQYLQADFSSIYIRPPAPHRLASENDKLARIAAMITNIDENVGRLQVRLRELGIIDNTIVMYLNDNGPNTMRYVGNMRGMKTRVDNGGIRSPLLIQWPRRIDADASSNVMCAHIDILPTVLDACGIEADPSLRLDGRSFLPLLTEEAETWDPRVLVFQSHRGNVPVRYHHFALHESPWKLVHPSGFGAEQLSGPPELELYHLASDPLQQIDLAGEYPEVVQRLRQSYDDWFDDVSSSRPDNYAPPRILIGTEFEPQSVLTRQDWRHVVGRPWGKDSNGFWLLESLTPGDYEVEIIMPSADHGATEANVVIGDSSIQIPIQDGRRRDHRGMLTLPAGKHRLSVNISVEGTTRGPHQVILTRQL